MLMKKSQYKSVMFTVSICIGSILLAILVAYACNLSELEKAKNEAYTAYQNAEQSLSSHRENMPGIVGSTALGGAVGTGGYMAAGAVFSSVASMNPATGVAITVTATAGAYVGWYSYLVWLEGKVAEKRDAYYESVANYEACANPPERYTYTDYGGHVYEFSTKEAYNDFLRNRGLSTI